MCAHFTTRPVFEVHIVSVELRRSTTSSNLARQLLDSLRQSVPPEISKDHETLRLSQSRFKVQGF